MSGGVSFSLSAFKRAEFVEGVGLITLVPARGLGFDPGRLVGVAFEVMEEVNATFDENDLAVEPSVGEHFAWLEAPCTVPTGVALTVTACDTNKALSRLLERVAAGFESRGVAGKLTPAQRDSPEYRKDTWPTLMGVALLPLAEKWATNYIPGSYMVSPCWGAPRVETEQVVRPLVEWVLQAEGPVYCGSLAITRVTPDANQLTRLLVEVAMSSTKQSPTMSLLRGGDPNAMRGLEVDRLGAITFTMHQPDISRHDQLTALNQLLVSLAPHLAAGFIKDCLEGLPALHLLLKDRANPAPVMTCHPNAHCVLAPFHDRVLYDAHVSQILTRHHLNVVGDLPASRWNITDLDNDRYLVTAQDPDPWFRTDLRPESQVTLEEYSRPFIPDEVLQTARANFARAIQPPVEDPNDLSRRPYQPPQP